MRPIDQIVTEIIRVGGGPANIARGLRMQPTAVAQWGRRARIPVWKRPPLHKLLTKNVGVDNLSDDVIAYLTGRLD